jgi:hypothetical protein
MQSRTLHLRVGRSAWAAVLLFATAVGAATPTEAQSVAVTDAVSREVAVRVDPSLGQLKQELVTDAVSREVAVLVGGTGGGTTTDLLVLDAVSREVAVRVDPIDGQPKSDFVLDAVSREVAVRVDPIDGQLKTQFVLDAVSRELAVRVEPTFGFDKGQLVRDSVSREFQIYVNPTDANGNGLADLLEPTVQTEMVYASSVPTTNSAWRDEGEAAGNPGCGEVCSCNSQFEPYAFNGGQGVPPDATYLVGGFGGFSLPSNRVISSVVADVMCRYNDGSSGAVDLRVAVGAQQLLLANQTFTSTAGCEYRFGGAGRVLTAPTGGWTPDAIANLTVSVRRAGSNTTTLRVTAFRITVTTVERDTDADGIADSLDNCPNQANPLQQDCDENGIGDACELILYPERDANMNGVIDACENVAGWLGGVAGAFNNPANWTSGRVPDAGTAVFLRAPDGGTFTMTTSSPVTVKSFVVAAGTVRLNLGGAFRVNELFTVSSGATLVVDGVDGIRTLELAGFSQVRGGGRLEIAPLGVVHALASGSFSGEPLSNLTFVLRSAPETPLRASGLSAFRGGVAVRLGQFATEPLPTGTRFTLIDAANPSTGFYSTLSAQGLADRFLQVVEDDTLAAGQLVLEVSSLQEFVRAAGSANSNLGAGEEPTAIVARNFTAAFDAFDDIAVTARRTDTGGAALPGNLYVFRGDGSGGASEQAVYVTGLEPIAIESADLNGDDRLDLAVVNRVSGTLQIFQNSNDDVSGFQLVETESVGVGSTYLALSPLFNAASLNPAVAGYAFLISSPTVGTIQPGKIVGGNATPFPTLPVPTSPGPVTPIEDSGREEGAFMATRSAPVDDEYGRVFKVEVFGDGTVTQGSPVLGPAQPLAIETGSLNADGFTDMVVAGLSSAEFGSVPSISVFPGTSIGFATGGALPLTDRPLGLAIGDFDADGKQDFAVALGTEVGGVEQGDFVRRFNNVTAGAANPVFESGANDILFDGEGVRRIRRADLNAVPPDDYAVLGETVTGAGLNVGGGGELRGFGGGRVFELATEPECAGDVNGDGLVDAVDLQILLSSWGGIGAADLDGSEVVDGGDLTILLSAWGACNAAS